jgi:ankyrin repeat protein
LSTKIDDQKRIDTETSGDGDPSDERKADGSVSNEEENEELSLKIVEEDLLGEDAAEIEDEDAEKALETSVDLLKNTPLQWAAFKGHLRVVWLLLFDGYSPNDLDSMGNNALHLAAVNGHTQVLKVLIDDGGSANVVNQYKNLPLDMATSREIREILCIAMEKGASMTAADIVEKHELNMKLVSGLSLNPVDKCYSCNL